MREERGERRQMREKKKRRRKRREKADERGEIADERGEETVEGGYGQQTREEREGLDREGAEVSLGEERRARRRREACGCSCHN